MKQGGDIWHYETVAQNVPVAMGLEKKDLKWATKSILDILKKNFRRVRRAMPDLRNKTGFHSSKHKVGDTVVLCQQGRDDPARTVRRDLVKIRSIAKKAGGVRLEPGFEDDHSYNIALDQLQFLANGDARRKTSGGRYFWLEEAASIDADNQTLVAHLRSHRNWDILPLADLLTIQAILVKYG